MCKQMSSGTFKDYITYKLFVNKSYIYISYLTAYNGHFFTKIIFLNSAASYMLYIGLKFAIVGWLVCWLFFMAHQPLLAI